MKAWTLAILGLLVIAGFLTLASRSLHRSVSSEAETCRANGGLYFKAQCVGVEDGK